MARPKSDDKRSAILEAAARIIAAEGLGATTAAIAKEAGISNGSLFTYFNNKTDLLNQLYIETKSEMAAEAIAGIPTDSDIRDQLLHLWTNWLGWSASCPEKRRTLAQLIVSDEITPESREAAKHSMTEMARILECGRENGPMRDVPRGLFIAMANAIADAAIDYMITDPANAEKYSMSAFDAFWRMIS